MSQRRTQQIAWGVAASCLPLIVTAVAISIDKTFGFDGLDGAGMFAGVVLGSLSLLRVKMRGVSKVVIFVVYLPQ